MNKRYIPLFKKLDEEKICHESRHIFQDKIYRKFIRDIANKKFANLEDILIMANDINTKVIKLGKGKWYS